MSETEIKIETNVPIPAGRVNSKKFPFVGMKVGDSFLVPLDGKERATLQSNVLIYAKKFSEKNQNEWKWKTARDGNGIRIWRTA